MRILSKAYEVLREKTRTKNPKEALLIFLKDLQRHESKLWGILITDLKNQEEIALEDTNHLIYLLNSQDKPTLKKIIKLKETKELLNDLNLIREDFLNLKKQIMHKERLKNLISEFTIKCVDEPGKINSLEKIFLLEKQLYDVLLRQDDELREFFEEINSLRIKKHDDDTIEYFIEALKRIRNLLAGHLDYHEFWDEERRGYSNISNILHSLVKEVEVLEIEKIS